VRTAAKRPGVVLAFAGVIAVAACVLCLRLKPSVSTDTLVDPSSQSYRQTQAFTKQFGEDPVVVLVEGDLQKTLLTSDLERLIGLEGCVSGNVPPEGLSALPPVCSDLARLKPVQVVYGPGTFINTAVGEIQSGIQTQLQGAQSQADAASTSARQASAQRGDPPQRQNELADSARNVSMQQFQAQLTQVALAYGIFSIPQVNDPNFVSKLVFDTSSGQPVPKPRFAFLFPTERSALIQVRLRPNLSDSQRERAISLVRNAVSQDQFHLQNGGRYVVTGVPVVVAGLAGAVERSLFVLLTAALLVMAGTLALVFRMRLKLLPLGLACLSCALTFGAIASLGGTLTLASIAALPVLIGLAVDYAIQFQARYAEHPSAFARGRGAQAALLAAARLGAPSIAAAGLATVAGFLALFLSPIPMVRSFGAILIAGIAIAFLSTLTAGAAVLVRDANRVRDVPPMLPRLRRSLRRVLSALAQGKIARHFVRRVAQPTSVGFARASGAYLRSLRRASQNPGRVLAVGLCVAVLGWVADTQTQVISDVRELVPQNLQALSDVQRLERDTGIGGELDVMVSGPDLTNPSVVSRMAGFQNDLLSKHGYRPGARCAQNANPPELCPALSLPDILGPNPQSQDINQLLASVPPYLSQGVISNDHKVANLAFGIRMMPLDRQRQLISDIRAHLHPPPGVRASVVGLPALAADANETLSSTLRRDLTLLVGLAAVFLVLFALRRTARAAVVPLVPIAFASGWSALLLFLLRIPLNPLSASLGVLVVAISTEFSVLLSARYRQERDERVPPKRAIERTYFSTGKYVLASGVTATMGFAVLMSSDIRMLRDFGAVTAIDLAVSLLGVVLVLPAALVAAENKQLVQSTKQGLRWLAGAIGQGARVSAWRLLRPRKRKQKTRV
jgi:uncharacterized protein